MNLAPLMKPASIAVGGAAQRMTRATRVVASLQGRPRSPDVIAFKRS
jgi:hypothetical protein